MFRPRTLCQMKPAPTPNPQSPNIFLINNNKNLLIFYFINLRFINKIIKYV